MSTKFPITIYMKAIKMCRCEEKKSTGSLNDKWINFRVRVVILLCIKGTTNGKHLPAKADGTKKVATRNIMATATSKLTFFFPILEILFFFSKKRKEKTNKPWQ